VPTGVALPNARERLFAAAERVLARDGLGAVTSRAVTAEAGVAKGVMHRHFADFDAFLAELILDRVAALAVPAQTLRDAVGRGDISDNLADVLAAVFDPVAVAVVALVITRDRLRARLRDAGAARFPLITEASAMVREYLRAEQALGRVAASADIAALAPTLIGATHLLFTDREGAATDRAALGRVVATVMRGVAPT
jgi:AcrR family transcriptional regulator